MVKVSGFKFKKNLLREPNLNFGLIVLLFLVIAFSPFVDIKFSHLFFTEGHFYLTHDGYLSWMVKFGFPFLLVALGLGVFLVWLFGYMRGRWFCGIDTRIMAFVTGSMILGPGLIVNGIFKTFWGRARPYEILEFGGLKTFSPPMVIANQCNLDCSFMSGHTAIGFWVFCFAYLVPCRYRVGAMVFALLFGSFLGLARIAQGLHFFSDVFFAAVITISVIVWLHYKLFPEDYKKC